MSRDPLLTEAPEEGRGISGRPLLAVAAAEGSRTLLEGELRSWSPLLANPDPPDEGDRASKGTLLADADAEGNCVLGGTLLAGVAVEGERRSWSPLRADPDPPDEGGRTLKGALLAAAAAEGSRTLGGTLLADVAVEGGRMSWVPLLTEPSEEEGRMSDGGGSPRGPLLADPNPPEVGSRTL